MEKETEAEIANYAGTSHFLCPGHGASGGEGEESLHEGGPDAEKGIELARDGEGDGSGNCFSCTSHFLCPDHGAGDGEGESLPEGAQDGGKGSGFASDGGGGGICSAVLA